MSETRKLTTILAADVAGYSRLAAADEERTLARLRALRSDLVDPAISIHHGRVVKRTGDGILVEFRSPVEAVRCAVEVQDGMAERNAGLPPERRIEFRVGVHLGDVVEEADGDLMGDAVNIAARIEGIAVPGGIYVSRAAHEQVDGKIAERFTDLGEKELKNIPKAVRVFALTRSREAAAPPSPRTSTPPRLSMVVLPFSNIGADPEQEYFVDGVTESLTTDLSRLSGSFVIARNTAFTYRGKRVDVKQIGRDLNVRYVLEGSVQRGGDRLRINVQLIEAETGAHLWAERFDKPLADLFEMQDEIVARLASQLSAQLIAAEAHRAERVPNPDSMDVYFQGMAQWNKGATPGNITEARRFFERSVALDPNNIEAAVRIAHMDIGLAGIIRTQDRDARLVAAEARIMKALAVAPDHAVAHFVLGTICALSNRAAQAIAECERALALDRNLADAYATIGLSKIAAGHAEETERHILDALRLSPHDHLAIIWLTLAGISKVLLAHYDEALYWFHRAIETNRNVPINHFYLAAALAQLQRWDEAHAAAKTGLRLDPTFTIRRFSSTAYSRDPVYLAQIKNLEEGMRKAGVPEGEPETPAVPAPPRLSIVVLPFANIGGDPEQEYFVDGVTESLTTDVSRMAGSVVIGRNTAFTYKGKSIDLKQIGRELNIRYVLEGSVQRGSDRLRVNVQLIDAKTGTHLWAERFDKPVADLFEMQDEIVVRLARQLDAELIAAEARRAEQSPHPDSMDLTFRGWALHNRGASTMVQAQTLFRDALALDPVNVEALAGLAATDALMVALNLGQNRTQLLNEAEDAASKALRLAPRHAMALYALGNVYNYSKRQTEAISAYEQAIAANPNLAAAHAFIGLAKCFAGHAEETEAYMVRALRLSPRDTYAAVWCSATGASDVLLGRDEEGAPWFRRAIELDRNYANPYFYLAGILVRQGRIEDAHKLVKDGLAINPAFTMARLRAGTGSASDNPVFLGQMERLYPSLCRAGVPEG